MKVITAPENYIIKEDEISVFLAGGITNCSKWQNSVIKLLELDSVNMQQEKFADKLVVFNPRRDNFPTNDSYESYRQIRWEFDALEKADIFSMYFTGGISDDQSICMYELGRNIVKMQMKYPIDWKDRIIISVEDDYKRKNDVIIQTELACGINSYVNTHTKRNLCREKHADSIITAYKKLIYKRS